MCDIVFWIHRCVAASVTDISPNIFVSFQPVPRAVTVILVFHIVFFLALGKGEAIETTLAALQVVPEPFRSFANTLVDICAYAGQSESLVLILRFFLFAHMQLSISQPLSVPSINSHVRCHIC